MSEISEKDRERARKLDIHWGCGPTWCSCPDVIAAALAAERERCAVVAEREPDEPYSRGCQWCSDGQYMADRIANAIRAIDKEDDES